MYALAIDAGSSSVRAALYDEHADLVPGSLSQIDIDLTLRPGGVAQVDPIALRLAIEQAVDFALHHPVVENGRIAVASMTTFWHSLVALDANQRPLTPVFTWADTRSAAEARDLRNVLDEEAVHQRTGCILHPSYLPAKILWLRRHNPGVASRATAYVSFAQYCTGVWLDSIVSSVSMASGSGLFNHRRCAWDDAVMGAVGVESAMLGELAPEPELLPAVNAEYAARWPALRDVPWRAPIGDGAASNLGVGCVTSNRLALMVGTSGAMRRCERDDHADAPLPPGLWRYRLDRERVLTGGALSDGGNVYAWLRDTLRLPSEEACEEALARREPGQHGLVVLPLWSGERSLGWVGDATATITGLKLHTDPLDIFHAALEAVAYRFAALYDAMSRGGETIVATGGGLRSSPAWLQMMADAIGCEVVASTVNEASLRGVALLGLHDVGLVDEDGLLHAPGGATYTPRLDYYERHREERMRQQILYEREVGPGGVNLLARQSRVGSD